MRVAIVTESFLPTVNGVTTSVCRVLEHLARRGPRGDRDRPGGPGHRRSTRASPSTACPSVAYRQFPVGLPGPQVAARSPAFAPDVLHAASPFLLGAQAIAAAARLGVPTVAVFQTDVARYARRTASAPRPRPSPGGSCAGSTTGATSRSCRPRPPCGTSSAPASSGSRRWGRGVDARRYHPNRRTRRGAPRSCAARLAPATSVVVGYVGRLAPEKQVERLAALRGSGGVRLAVVGDGPGAPALARRLAAPRPGLPRARSRGDELAAAYAALRRLRPHGHEETFGQTRAGGARRGPPGGRARAPAGRSTSSRTASTGTSSIPATTTRCGAAVGTSWRRAAPRPASARRVGGPSWGAPGRPSATSCSGHYEAARAGVRRAAGPRPRGPTFSRHRDRSTVQARLTAGTPSSGRSSSQRTRLSSPGSHPIPLRGGLLMAEQSTGVLAHRQAGRRHRSVPSPASGRFAGHALPRPRGHVVVGAAPHHRRAPSTSSCSCTSSTRLSCGSAREAYDAVIGTYKNPIMGLGETALVAAIVFHALNGLRIILIDFWSPGHQAPATHVLDRDRRLGGAVRRLRPPPPDERLLGVTR